MTTSVTKQLMMAAVFTVAVATQSSSGRAQAPAVPLFIELPAGLDRPEIVEEAVARLQGQPSTEAVQVYEMRDVAVITNMLEASTEATRAGAEEAPIEIALPDGRRISVTGMDFQDTPRGVSTWFGRVTNVSDNPLDQIGTVTFSIQGERVVGTINLSDAAYEVATIGDSNFAAIVKSDQGQAPPDDPPENLRFENARPQQRGDILDEAAPRTIRVLVAYTPAARVSAEQQRGSVDLFVADLIAQANATFMNNQVGARYELASLLPVSYTETGVWGTDRNRFFLRDGYMDAVFDEREDVEADLAILLFRSSGYCGEARAIGATADEAFAVVDVHEGCTRKYTFTHETGHLLGAEHNPEHASRPPYRAYGHGFIAGDIIGRTMMAYQHQCSPCTRLLYWSSPLVRYPNQSGVPLGTAELHDNARVVAENVDRASAFRDPRAPGEAIAQYPDGTLVRANGAEVYVVVNGERHLVPDLSSGGTPEEDAAILQISESQLNDLVQGPALEVALQQWQGPDEVISSMPRRFMESNATLSMEAARLDVWTHIWTRQPWIGFTGGVMVLFGGAGGEYLGNTDLYQYGVDGFRIPFKTWNREVWWSESVPPEIAARTTQLHIVHSHAPRDRLFGFLEDAKRATTIVADIADQVRRVIGGAEERTAPALRTSQITE